MYRKEQSVNEMLSRINKRFVIDEEVKLLWKLIV